MKRSFVPGGLWVAAVCMLAVGYDGRADSPLPAPHRYEAWSPARRFVAVVDPQSGIAVHAAGSTDTLWQVKEWFRWVFLADDGEHMVTGYNGMSLIPVEYKTNLVLVTFWKSDQKFREVTVGELFPDTNVLRRTVSHYFWGEIQGFDQEGKLSVRLCDDTVLRFDPANGERIPAPKLDRKEVLAIAEKVAQQRGIQLTNYQVPRIKFEAKANAWWVMFTRNPPAMPGGHFGIRVDDKTKATKFFGGR